MSLAELFYAKQSSQSRFLRFRRRRQPNASCVEPLASRFLLEALESRILMSATPGLLGATGEMLLETADVSTTAAVVAATGHLAPNSNGLGTSGTFSVLTVPVINDRGQIAFFSEIAGSASTGGTFRTDVAGNLFSVLRAGDPAPLVGGGTSSTSSIT
jgi:hypothetical protein